MEIIFDEKVNGLPLTYKSVRGTIRFDTVSNSGMTYTGRASWSVIFKTPNGKLVAVDGKFEQNCL